MLESEDKIILLVEDDSDLLSVMKSLLTSFGYSVITAQNGESAVKAFEKNNPDLTLMDVKMPVMDGYDAFFKIKEKDRDARIIMMTGFEADPRLADAKSHCLIYLLEKPIDPTFLEELVRRHVSASSC